MTSTPTPPSTPRRFVLVACEASGDLLGEGLVIQLRERYPDARIVGVGGERMQSAGMELWEHYSVLNVMGVAEVLRHLPRLLKLRRRLFEMTLEFGPDVFVGIDGPDFNLGLEKRLKRRGVRTVHYVSPSIWAWREGRARKIRQCADRVLCLFPMEPPIYARYGMPSTYVGHPLAHDFEDDPDQAAARRALDIDPQGRWLAILPGSRVSEVERLGRVFLQAALLLHRRHPDIKFLVPLANERTKAAFLRLVDTIHLPGPDDQVAGEEHEWAGVRAQLSIIEGQSHRVMKAADAVLLASGTAALEGMLAKRPMVVAYRIAPLTHFIVKGLGLLRINRYSLPNVLAGDTVVPELMQADCTAPRIAEELGALIERGAAAHAQVGRFHALHAQLRGSGSRGAADAVVAVASGATGG